MPWSSIFFRQTLRQIRRHPLFYFLNLTGLAPGITCAFVLLSYVRQEWSYDPSVPGAEQVYRIGITLEVDKQTFPIGIPVAWLLAHRWLQDFVYRIELSGWMFAFPAFAGLLIAFLTVAYQVTLAAMSSPAEALQDE